MSNTIIFIYAVYTIWRLGWTLICHPNVPSRKDLTLQLLWMLWEDGPPTVSPLKDCISCRRPLAQDVTPSDTLRLSHSVLATWPMQDNSEGLPLRLAEADMACFTGVVLPLLKRASFHSSVASSPINIPPIQFCLSLFPGEFSQWQDVWRRERMRLGTEQREEKIMSI